MKLFIILCLLCFSVFGADDKAGYVKTRYFPVSWEPPTVKEVGGVVVISPSVPNFDDTSKLKTFIEVEGSSVEKEKKDKEPVFTLFIKGVAKKIYIGRTFKIGNQSYKFLGEKDEGYVILDMKTNKEIIFTKNSPEKK